MGQSLRCVVRSCTLGRAHWPGCLPVCLSACVRSVTPSSIAHLVECVYRIDVEADLPMAPDIEIQLPVQIYAAEPEVPVVYAEALAAFDP